MVVNEETPLNAPVHAASRDADYALQKRKRRLTLATIGIALLGAVGWLCLATPAEEAVTKRAASVKYGGGG